MAKLKLVTERKLDGGEKVYDFRCPYPTGCGETGDDTPGFSSVGWADRKHAVDRGKTHIHEHETGEPMPELHEFRVARGLTQASAGQAVTPDDWEF